MSDDPADSTAFADADSATEFVLELDGELRVQLREGEALLPGQRASRLGRLVLLRVHLESDLIDHLAEAFDLDLVYDCTLYMADVEQTWYRSWLYEPETTPTTASRGQPTPADD